jgi:hypothetical protein
MPRKAALEDPVQARWRAVAQLEFVGVEASVPAIYAGFSF